MNSKTIIFIALVTVPVLFADAKPFEEDDNDRYFDTLREMEENSESLPSPRGFFEWLSKPAKNEWIEFGEMEENSEDDIREIADNVKERKIDDDDESWNLVRKPFEETDDDRDFDILRQMEESLNPILNPYTIEN